MNYDFPDFTPHNVQIIIRIHNYTKLEYDLLKMMTYKILTVEFPEVSNPNNSVSKVTHDFKKIDFLLQNSDIEFIENWFLANNS